MSRDVIGSNTYRGMVIAVAGPLLARYGVDVQDKEVLAVIDGLLAVTGMVLAMWGRQTATGPVTHVMGAPLPKALVPNPPAQDEPRE